MQRIKGRMLLASATIFMTITVNAAGNSPWRLNEALSLPAGFTISGQHRIRFETLDGQFRGARNGGDQVLALRTNLLAEVGFNRITLAAEMQDSRVELADSGTPLSTTVVNSFELLQAYVDFPFRDFLVPGSESRLRGGRITMDVGSRRLVARNRFRNTINAFTGVDWQWSDPGKNRLRIFYTFPVQRRVSGNLLDNRPAFDAEYEAVRFWGIYYAPARLLRAGKGEVYLFGLDEDDSSGLATRNRRLYTTGFRIYRNPAEEHFDYQLESVYQFGNSRTSTAAVTDLDHFAHFQHIEAGYTFAASWKPQLLFQYDYASGDVDSLDSDNRRFDTMFGARRFDFGPTGVYGPFARANLSTPGLRLKLQPGPELSAFVSLRGFWLASDDDAWTTAGISNPAGSHDNYIGTQIEAMLRWELLPGNIRFETGGAHIFAGDLMNNAGKQDSTYFYAQTVFSF